MDIYTKCLSGKSNRWVEKKILKKSMDVIQQKQS